MHHLVTEWVTLPALFTWLARAKALLGFSFASHLNRASGGVDWFLAL
jgi:hypothetical protein